jgi:geranylgeranyl transferase type-1 subunit beta
MLAGLNYCSIATLSFVGLLKETPISAYEVADETGIDTSSCVRWMLDRQTTWIDEEDEDDEEDNDDEEKRGESGPERSALDMAAMKDDLVTEKVIAGFCGRCGKIADTCYCFWNVGALAVSPSLEVDQELVF